MAKYLAPTLIAALLCSCAFVKKERTVAETAYNTSPVCQSLGKPGDILTEDATLIAQEAVDLPALQFGAAIDAFIAAKGVTQFQCAEVIAEALLGYPLVVDGGVPTVSSAPTAPSALVMGASGTSFQAVNKLREYKATHGIGP